MNKKKFVDKLIRWQKAFKIGTIVSAVVFGVTFTILFIWETVAPYTEPMWIVWTLIVATLFPYLFAGAYFVTKFIIKIYAKKKNNT
ncbi:MAG: hypothetical protein IJ272_01635 [Clostridia bacterium]|nr:hypothetical protein [Clostridia bacterium]